MVRDALRPSPRLRRGPRKHANLYPPVSIGLAILAGALPAMSLSGWWPDIGFLFLVAWRLQRSDAFPGWWAMLFGLAADLVLRHPIGLSVVTYCLAMLIADIVDYRVRWRDYWTDWAAAGVMIAIAELFQWEVARLAGAGMPISATGAPVLIAILAYPLVASFVMLLDRFRLRS
ncbi:rod shape-determining protein MreD [Sphingomicrobium nitratireducens]|uniref:rod shape-determining protein MreD n=1 Tax=Sphingomicrobium nitratireducens TaxID=2964666 RepID=UPI00223EF90C|nr:rod shape-determining protein MreD [Sphingomicrobium nitratireducens]